jgi:hypothetical protein
LAGCSSSEPEAPAWTADETKLIGALSVSKLPLLPADPSNAFADNPEATTQGEALFCDT